MSEVSEAAPPNQEVRGLVRDLLLLDLFCGLLRRGNFT
jgi:hypothetical protein